MDDEFPNFPLYQTLSLNATNDDITHEQKMKIIMAIQKMNSMDQTNLFTVVKIYFLKNTTSNLFDVPYNGTKVGETKFTFNLEKFPNKLKQMIYKFCELIKTN